MTKEEAWYILRAVVALSEEGIGPDNPQPGDRDIEQEAYRIAGDRLPEYNRWPFEPGHRTEPTQ